VGRAIATPIGLPFLPHLESRWVFLPHNPPNDQLDRDVETDFPKKFLPYFLASSMAVRGAKSTRPSTKVTFDCCSWNTQSKPSETKPDLLYLMDEIAQADFENRRYDLFKLPHTR